MPHFDSSVKRPASRVVFPLGDGAEMRVDADRRISRSEFLRFKQCLETAADSLIEPTPEIGSAEDVRSY